MKKLVVLFSFFFLMGTAAAQGGGFADAVSSASYSLKGGNPPVLSFYDEDAQVRFNTKKGLRPKSDAITSATYTFSKSTGLNRAIYQNNAGVFVGFILSGNSIKKTAPAPSQAKVDFNTIEGTYSR